MKEKLPGSSAMLECITLLSQFKNQSLLLWNQNGLLEATAIVRRYRDLNCAKGPLVEVDCRTLPPAIGESIGFFFGWDSRSGVDPKLRKGKLLAANGGVLHLQNIDALSREMETILGNCFEQRTVTPLQGISASSISGTIICSTSLPSAEALQALSSPFFYRLLALSIDLPPLSERPEDVPFLVDLLLEEARVEKDRALEIREAVLQDLDQKSMKEIIAIVKLRSRFAPVLGSL